MKPQFILVGVLSCSMLWADDLASHQISAPLQQVETPQPQPQPLPGDDFLPIKNGDQIVRDFQAKYNAAKKPRFLIYINRDLVQQRGEMMEIANSQKSTQVKGDAVNAGNGTNVQVGNNSNTTGGNLSLSPVVTGQGGEKNTTNSLSVRVLPESDKGVAPITDYDAREIEEAFSERFSQAGAHFVDQTMAATLQKSFASAGDRFLTAPATNAEKEEVDSVKKSADVVIEILARRKSVIVPTPAGDQYQEQLDLIATAFDVRQPGLVLARISSDSLFGFKKRDGAYREQRASLLTSDDFIDQVSLGLMDRLSF